VPRSPQSEPVLPRVAAGDPAAARECISRYAGLVYALARRFTGNTADADDATQEIFISLWKSAGAFDPAQGSESTFVAMVARRRLIDSRRRQLHSTVAMPDDLPAPPPTRPCSDEAAHAVAALARLPAEQQNVLRLAVLDGMTHGEVQKVTGLPLGTVKTLIRRGLLSLRSALRGQRGEDD
jgi:RNA polymerase sigma factor (sigma-70 family)